MKRMIATILVLLLAPALFAGGDSEAGNSDGVVTIDYWDNAEVDTLMYDWVTTNIALFAEVNPQINIEYTNTPNGDQYLNKLSTEMAANNAPDFFMSWTAGRFEPFVNAGRVHPLNDIIAASEVLTDNVNPGNASGATFDGIIYGIPIELAGEGIFYNKAIFAENGLTPPETWDDLVNIINVLNDAGVTPFSLANKDPWPGTIPFMAIFDRVNGPDAYRPAVFEQQTVFNTEPYVRAAEYLYELVELNAFPQNFNSLEYGEGTAMFSAGLAGMRFNGTWEMPGLIEQMGDDLGLFEWPSMPEGASDTGWPILQNRAYAISSASDYIDETAQFLEFIITDERQAELAESGFMIATRNVPFDESKLHPVAAQFATEMANTPNPILIWDVLLGQNIGKELNLATQAILGGADIQSTLDSLNRIAEVEWD